MHLDLLCSLTGNMVIKTERATSVGHLRLDQLCRQPLLSCLLALKCVMLQDLRYEVTQAGVSIMDVAYFSSRT